MKSFLASAGLLLLALDALGVPPAVADPFEAGLAVVDITPTSICPFSEEARTDRKWAC